MVRAKILALAGAMLLGGALFASPASAQYSKSYQFLEAVRDKDGTKVTEALDVPGTTVINTRDGGNGDTAMHIVTRRRDLTWMGFIAKRGANVNARNDKGETPLVIATSLGFVEGVDLLVKLGATIDEANATGETPLIAAVHNRDVAMARVLIKAGANPRRNDNSGRSALDYAHLDGKGNPVLAVLEEAEKTAQTKAPTYGPSF